MKKAAIVVFIAVVAWQSLGAQAPTGTLQGRVVREGTDSPIPNAQVYFNLPTGNPSTLTVNTDGGGNFVIRDVPAGRHVLFASRDGYFGPSLGAVQSNVRATVTVVSGRTTNVSFALVPGGVLAGKVQVPTGDAAADIPVQALRMMYVDGVPTLQPISTRTTDDLGNFRLFRLPPGQYYVVATPAGPRGAGGVARSATPGAPTPPPDPTPEIPITAVRTFYPNVIEPSQATALDVRGADENNGVNIRLQPLAGATISGQITSTILPSEMVFPPQNASRAATTVAAGVVLPNVALSLYRHDVDVLQDPTPGPSIQVTFGPPDNGRFELRNVPPGKYDVYAGVPDILGYGPAPGPGRAATPLGFSRTTIEVASRDIGGVQVTLHHGIDLKGRITIDGNTPPSVANVRVSAQPADSAAKIPSYQQVGRTQPLVNPDGTFMIPALPDARYRFQVMFGAPVPLGPVGPNSPVAGQPLPALPVEAPPVSSNAYVADIRLGGASVFDSGFSSADIAYAQAEILVRTDGGGVDGVVRGADQMPASSASVVLIPAQSRRANPSLYKTATFDAVGRFSLSGVAPGRYKIFAWDNIPGAPYRNAEFLKKYEERGVSLDVIAGGRITAAVDLIVVKPLQ